MSNDKEVIKLKMGENDVSNENYHADTEFYSSSVLKLMLKDKKKFYDSYILKLPREEQGNKDAFTLGSYLHTMILEPELLEVEYAVLPFGMVKRGEAWKEFKAANIGKTIIKSSQVNHAKKMFEAYKEQEYAVGLIAGGESEKTLCVEMDGIKIKVRADYVNVEKGYLADVKTTSGETYREAWIDTVDRWGYLLSAALYCKAFSIHYGKKFDFFFIVCGKFEEKAPGDDDEKLRCEVYRISYDSMKKGLDDVDKALTIYKKNIDNDSWLEYEVEEV